MKEFDFDELDKAVNSLMKDAPGSAPVKADDDVTTVTLSDVTAGVEGKADDMPISTSPFLQNNNDTTTTDVPTPNTDDEAPVADSAESELEPEEPAALESPETDNTTPDDDEGEKPEEPETTNTTDNSVANDDTPESAPKVKQSTVPHRKGRFMDVKHDASSMRSGGTPNKYASRQGITLQPTPSDEKTHLDTAPVSTASKEPATDVEVPTAEKSEEAIEKPEALLPKPSESMPDTVAASDSPEKPTEYSAFIPDAKVEKRPLGQPQTVTSAKPVDSPVASETPLEDNDKSNNSPDVGTPVAPDATLSAEYDQHLMAIESGDTPEDTPESKDSTLAVSGPEKTSVSADAVASSTSTPTGPASIQQQYKEAPSSGDQTNGAIYDTASYHQPLKHPEKKKSGLLWVVLIVIIILAGIGGGAFIYLNGM